jgi:hypothetical protein
MKPIIRTGPASSYASSNEIIREVGVRDGRATGCLLSVSHLDDGTLLLSPYSGTGEVVVRVGRGVKLAGATDDNVLSKVLDRVLGDHVADEVRAELQRAVELEGAGS